MKSEYVCERCGLPIRLWGKKLDGLYWKHSGGWNSRSCGRPPIVIKREKYEADIRAGVAQVIRRLGS